jgi:hypothetical protein
MGPCKNDYAIYVILSIMVIDLRKWSEWRRTYELSILSPL